MHNELEPSTASLPDRQTSSNQVKFFSPAEDSALSVTVKRVKYGEIELCFFVDLTWFYLPSSSLACLYTSLLRKKYLPPWFE